MNIGLRCVQVSRRLPDSHLRCTLGTRSVRAAGWQGGRQDVFLLFLIVCCLQVGNFPPTLPRVCGTMEFLLWLLLFVCFVYFIFGGPSTKGRFDHYCAWMGSRLDGGSRGGGGMSSEGHGCPCLSPFFWPVHFSRAHHYSPPSPNRAAESRGVIRVSRRDLGMVVGMGVWVFLCLSVLQHGNAALRS